MNALFLLAQAAPGANMTDAGSMIGHFMQSLPGIVRATDAFADLAGVTILFAGIFKFASIRRTSNPNGRYAFVTPILWVLVGSALLNLAASVETGLVTIFGGGADVHNLLAYQASGEVPSAARQLIKSLVALVRLFGLWAAIRGLMVLRHVGDPNYQRGGAGGPLKTGLMRFGFGCILINIVQTVDILAGSIGFGHSL